MKPLRPEQTTFKANEVTYLDRKSIQVDRMLLNLFELLRFDGRPVARRRRVIDVDMLVALAHQHPERFLGFGDHPHIMRAWLRNDLLDILNRGKPEKEMIAGARPFHLNAFKLANPRAVQDYGASTQVWAMLEYADPTILVRLKEFFGVGLDFTSDQYDGHTQLDLETMAILGLVDQDESHPTPSAVRMIKPLCTGQGRVLADDLRRLLTYQQSVPRHVLAGYIRTTLALHLALYVLRLLRIVPDRVDCAKEGRRCPSCAIDGGASNSCDCPYSFEIVVDLTDDRTSGPAALARASTEQHFDQLAPYVRSVLLLNRVKEFAQYEARTGRRRPPQSVDDLLELVAHPPAEMDGFFGARAQDLLSNEDDEDEDPIVTAILELDSVSPLEKYVELVCLQRMRRERPYMVRLIDSLAQKNKAGGFMKQPAGTQAPRRFVLGSTLLETLIQIAVLETNPDGRYQSHNVLLDDFVEWLRKRYGFVIYAPAHREVPPAEQDAWRFNERALRTQLRQIGFFTDLSDAYNSQTLRPRYQVR